MSEYLIASVLDDKISGERSILAIVINYDGTKSPTVKDHFISSGSKDSMKHVYFEFENFFFSHQRATLSFWGKFHIEKLKEMSDQVNGDFDSLFDMETVLNLQVLFKDRLNMKRFVGFRDAYTKISGLRFFNSEKNKSFSSLENMGHFIPYVLGDKRINRIDIKR